MSVLLAGKTEHRAAAPHNSLRFDEFGSGRVKVVLLHGLFGSPANWRPIMEDLGDYYRFFALQLPIDYSGDRRHTSFQSLGQLTDHVARFFQERGLDRAVLCGNSLGGQVALDFCLHHPERVEKLVLTGSAGLFERDLSGGKLGRLSRKMVREQACEIFHDPVHVTDELVESIYTMLIDRKYRRFLLRVAKATRDRHMGEDLANVHVPTMIIWGRNDTITPPFVGQQFREHIRHAELSIIDECGHAPPIEQPKEFAQLLHSFLGNNTADCASISCKPR
jgi:pimeloyl-ACP methyl ester carboxylesterase